jgi:hypothetical protein
MKTIECRSSFYGKVVFSDRDDTFSYEGGLSDFNKLFGSLLGKRISDQYKEGITIFKLGNKQVEVLKNYFEEK